MFAKYDPDCTGALSLGQLFGMMGGNRNAVDPFGVSFLSAGGGGGLLSGWVGLVMMCLTMGFEQWFAAVFEFGTTWLLLQQNGKVYKDDLRGVYDVSLAVSSLVACKPTHAFNSGTSWISSEFELTEIKGLHLLPDQGKEASVKGRLAPGLRAGR